MRNGMKKVVLMLAIVSASGAAQADVVYGQSYDDYFTLGSTFIYGNPGVKPKGDWFSRSIDGYTAGEYRDAQGVYSNWSDRGASSLFAGSEGIWSLKQVGNQDVWFGEFDATSKVGDKYVKTAGTHTVLYSGENGNVATTLPMSGAVTYTVDTMHHYNGTAMQKSAISADFAKGIAQGHGDISFEQGVISVVGADVKLAANDVTVASSSGTGGHLDGKFYGAGASAVLGTVKFSDREKDIAFGGKRD